MSAKVYSNLRRGSPPFLKKTSTVSISFSKLKPNGEVMLTSRYNDQVEDVRFFVVPGVESVLSGHICINPGLLKRVHQLKSKKPGARVELDNFPELFTGLGCMPGPSCSKLGLDNPGLVRNLNSDLKD